MLDLPVVDADPVGRAVPEIEHSLFKVHGLPIAPQAVTNEVGRHRHRHPGRRRRARRSPGARTRRRQPQPRLRRRPRAAVGPGQAGRHLRSREPRAARGRALRLAQEREEDAGRGCRGRLRRPRRLPRPGRRFHVGGARRVHVGSAGARRRRRGRRLLVPHLVQEREPAGLARRRSGRHCLRISSAVSRESRASRSPIRITRPASASTWSACPRRRSGARLPVSRSSDRVTSGSTSTSYRWRSGSPKSRVARQRSSRHGPRA